MGKRSGFLVKTKTGKEGVTYHTDEKVNGKTQVHLNDGTVLLCNDDSLQIIGFSD